MARIRLKDAPPSTPPYSPDDIPSWAAGKVILKDGSVGWITDISTHVTHQKTGSSFASAEIKAVFPSGIKAGALKKPAGVITLECNVGPTMTKMTALADKLENVIRATTDINDTAAQRRIRRQQVELARWK